MATAPAFITAGRIGLANLVSANTALDGSGSIAPLLTGAVGGTRVLEINVRCAASSAAAYVGLFYSSDSGTTWRLIDTYAVTAVTVSTTTAPFKLSTTYANLILPSAAHRLGVTTTIAQVTNVVAFGGDF